MASTEIPKVWYDGNCHCAAVKYKVLLPSLDSYEIISCNCSICTRNGYLNIYPKREELVFSRGAETLKGYYFGNKDCEHKFCPNCGSSVLIDPHGRKSTEDLVGVNVRMLRDLDVKGLKLRHVDGQNIMGPEYNPE